jgi:flagellar basal body P-ring protein FlgI
MRFMPLLKVLLRPAVLLRVLAEEEGGGIAAGRFAITQGVPTSAMISNGAIVERSVLYKLSNIRYIHLALKNPDFTTAKRIADAINKGIGRVLAEAMNPATVSVFFQELIP